MALWSGRFTENVSEFTQRFGASLPVDKALYVQDIAGSKAHAKMLAKVGVISEEDIHMSVEKALTAEIGDAGARLHTGRSRNDQVATDTRLYAKQRATDLMRANVALRHALIGQAEANFGVILPGIPTFRIRNQFCSRTLFLRMSGCFRAVIAVCRLHEMRPTPVRWAQLRWLGQRIRLIGR